MSADADVQPFDWQRLLVGDFDPLFWGEITFSSTPRCRCCALVMALVASLQRLAWSRT